MNVREFSADHALGQYYEALRVATPGGRERAVVLEHGVHAWILTRVSADVCEPRQEAGVPTLPGDNALPGSPMTMSDDARGHMIAVLAGMVWETRWRS